MWFKALGYISYVIELLTLASQAPTLSKDQLAYRAADVVFRAVDYALQGKASRRVSRYKITEAVFVVVDAIDDVLR